MFLFSLILESVSGLLSAMPALLMFHILSQKKAKKAEIKLSAVHTTTTYLFCFFVIGTLAVTGVPSVYNIRWAPNLNLIPFTDLTSNLIQYIQNMVLFIPFGFLLPLLWKKFEKFFPVLAFGFLFSLAVEFIQLFNFRATDVDDLLMNTLGTVLGYAAFLVVKRVAPSIPSRLRDEREKHVSFQNRETYILLGLSWASMFLIQPIISPVLWNLYY